ALVGETLGELGHLRAEAGPVALGEPRALRQRTRAIAVDRVRGLGDDDDVGARALRHGDMSLRHFELFARGALQELGRIPAADERHAIVGELVLQRRAVGGQLVALLHADDAGFPGLGEAGLERRVAADLLQVVVAPADRVGADAYAHVNLQRAGFPALSHNRGGRPRLPA